MHYDLLCFKRIQKDAHIIKKFENKFIIDEWFQFRKKATLLLIFEKWFNSQTTFNTFVKEKNRYVYKTCRKNKARTAKIYFEIDRSKKKEVEERLWRIYTFFYKDSLNDLNDIENSDSEYKSKRHQKKNLLSMKKKVWNRYKKKDIKKIKAYYTLIKHSISVQTLMKLDNHSIY